MTADAGQVVAHLPTRVKSLMPQLVRDLIGLVENGSVKLKDVKDEELPEDMKKMTPEERQKYVDTKIAERAELRKKIEDLDS